MASLPYKRARFYDSVTGEFTSPDPLEYVDGMSLYRAYFAVHGVDPSGLLLYHDHIGNPWGVGLAGEDPVVVRYPRRKPSNLDPPKGVQVCCASVNLIPAGVREGLADAGVAHCWLRTPNKSGGLYAHPDDQTADGGLPASPCYGTRTVIWDHDEWVEKYNGKCVDLPDCSVACVERWLKLEQDMGTWSPAYQCQSFVTEVLQRCNCVRKCKRWKTRYTGNGWSALSPNCYAGDFKRQCVEWEGPDFHGIPKEGDGRDWRIPEDVGATR
jgi:hypothetical protein